MTHRRTSLSPHALGRRIAPIAASEQTPHEPTPPRPSRVSQEHVNRGVLATWWLLLLVGTFLQPTADGGNPEVLGALDTVLLLATLTVMFAVTAMLLRTGGGAAGGWMAFGGGLFFLGLSLACPATDHHAVAGWWYGQLAASAGMALSGLAGVFHARRRMH